MLAGREDQRFEVAGEEVPLAAGVLPVVHVLGFGRAEGEELVLEVHHVHGDVEIFLEGGHAHVVETVVASDDGAVVAVGTHHQLADERGGLVWAGSEDHVGDGPTVGADAAAAVDEVVAEDDDGSRQAFAVGAVDRRDGVLQGVALVEPDEDLLLVQSVPAYSRLLCVTEMSRLQATASKRKR